MLRQTSPELTSHIPLDPDPGIGQPINTTSPRRRIQAANQGSVPQLTNHEAAGIQIEVGSDFEVFARQRLVERGECAFKPPTTPNPPAEVLFFHQVWMVTNLISVELVWPGTSAGLEATGHGTGISGDRLIATRS